MAAVETVCGLEVELIQSLTYQEPFRQRELLLLYSSRIRVGDWIYALPSGLLSDGASIPRVLWRIAPPIAGTYRPGSVWHDGGYKGLLLRWRAEEGSDRAEVDWPRVEVVANQSTVDWLFHILMLWNGTPRVQSWLFYKAVRFFGFIAWNNEHRKYSLVDPMLLDYTSGLPPPEHLPVHSALDEAMDRSHAEVKKLSGDIDAS